MIPFENNGLIKWSLKPMKRSYKTVCQCTNTELVMLGVIVVLVVCLAVLGHNILKPRYHSSRVLFPVPPESPTNTVIVK